MVGTERNARCPLGIPLRVEINKQALDLIDLREKEFNAGHRDEAEKLLEKALVADPFLLLGSYMPINVPVTVGPNTVGDVFKGRAKSRNRI